MKKKRILVGLILLAVAVTSCASKQASDESESSRVMAEDMVAGMEAPTVEEAGGYGMVDTVKATNAERIVIKNADLSIVVTDPVSALDTIATMAEQKGGFVVNSYVYKVTYSSDVELPAGNITIRVPAELLDETLVEIKALVEDADMDVLSESVSGQDVTSEVTDLESRLRNLQQAEEQLLEIMDNATDTEDVMAVFQQLTSIREDIEVLQGQIKYYQESAQLSAIYVNVQAKEAVSPITIGGWRPSLTVQRALQALIDGLKFLVNALIWIIIFVAPIALVIGLPIYFIVKASKKKRKNQITEKKE
ncbi:MAG TPA: hypothetical protein DCK95_08340 [Anaerolineaceae bacterium]|nr:hypothetical protein [Anaerolineaceae bacterium]